MNERGLAAQQQEFDTLTSQMAEISNGLLIAPEEHRDLHTRVLQTSYARAVEFLVNNPELARHYREIGELATSATAEQIALEETSLEQLNQYVEEGLLTPEDVAQAAGQLALKKQALETGDEYTIFESLFGSIAIEEDEAPASTPVSEPTVSETTTTSSISAATLTESTPTPTAPPEKAPKPRRPRGSGKELSASAAEEFVTPGWRHFNLDDARRLGIINRETGQVLLSKLDQVAQSVVKYSLLNENGFRMERLRKDVSEFMNLSPKEWATFKNHFRDVTQKAIDEALQKAGITTTWHEVGQRRGQRYRLSIEDTSGDQTTDTPPAPAASKPVPPASPAVPATPPAANTPPTANPELSRREQYLAHQAAERLFTKQCTFAEELAAGVKEMLQRSEDGQVKRSLIIIKAHRALGGDAEVSREDVEIAIDNILEADMVHKGRPEGGSRTISLFATNRSEKNGGKNDGGECKKPGALTEAEQALVPAVLDHLVSLKLEQGDTVKGVHAIVSLIHKNVEVETIRSVIRKLERAGTIRTEADRNYGRGRKGMLAVMDKMEKRNEWRNSPSLVIAEINAVLTETTRK